MPLFGSEAQQVVQEANASLVGAFVQKISAPTPREVFLELRAPGKSWRLLLSADMQTGRLSLAKERPAAPKQPQSIQQALRKHLLGAKLVEARAQAGIWLLWQRAERRLWLWANWKQGYIALGEAEGAWLSFSSKPPEGLKVGMPCLLPPFEEDGRVSRLVSPPEGGALQAAARLMEEKAKAQKESDTLRPLKARLLSLQKTMAKVQAEAERLPLAQTLQAEAEALAQNMSKLRRGASCLSLEAFLPDGTVETRVLSLNPAKTPKEEMEARFHKAKRLRRGIGIAKARLGQLEAEAEALRRHIESGLAPASPASPAQEAGPRLPPSGASKSLPYRAYLSAAGQPIWVGRGAKHNEALSFQLAKPWHLWLHARGQSGAHVLVPLSRNEEVKAETLLDAAHLAWHFSDGRKEPVGEVSYVEARYLRRPKGKPGAVLLRQEKTLRLRVEKARLDRLLLRPEP